VITQNKVKINSNNLMGGCGRGFTRDSVTVVCVCGCVTESEKISLRFLAVYDYRRMKTSSLRKETKKGRKNSKNINVETMIVKNGVTLFTTFFLSFFLMSDEMLKQ
jgi:hypothetical protein